MKEKRLFMFKKITLNILIFIGSAAHQVTHSSWHCDVKPLAWFIQKHKEIKYKLCHNEIPFHYDKSPVTDDHRLHPYQGFFNKTFILTIPHGKVFGFDGWVMIDDMTIGELIWQNMYTSRFILQEAKKRPMIVKKGTIAVIAQSGYNYYYHWLVEVLGRLALLEIHGISYDYLYVPTHKPYMKELLELWGIDSTKIINAYDDYLVTGDELVVPSLVAKVTTSGCPRLAHYIPTYLLAYIKEKLLKSIDVERCVQEEQFCKKVFISRKDSAIRKTTNEDEVFALLEAQGFKRYTLSTMSNEKAIALFKNAEIIIGSSGSNLANVIFCDPNTMIVDIFQAKRDCTFNYIAQNLGLRYTCVKTMDFIDDNDGQFDSAIPLDTIKTLIHNLKEQGVLS